MKQERPPASPREPGKPGAETSQYLSTRGLAIVFAMTITVYVGRVRKGQGHG